MARHKNLTALTALTGLLIAARVGWTAEAPAAPPPATKAVAPATKKDQPPDIVLKGDGRCTSCHDENDSPQVLAIGKTRHGVGADQRTPTCVSCHGESVKHEKEAGRAGKTLTMPDVAYGKKSANSAEERNQVCLKCHQGANRISWQSSAHATRDVACTSCHKIHTANDKVRDKLTQTEVCYTCHKETRAQMSRPSHHPVPEGKMSCASCHNVHGDNPKGLIKASTNGTCYECHMEKRGPFLHNHQPVTEDCAICHNPHGTTAPTLLKQRQPLLCQNCHNVDGHRTQVLNQPGARSTSKNDLGSSARGCLNCHTNIHGSNSTTSSSSGGRFRK